MTGIRVNQMNGHLAPPIVARGAAANVTANSRWMFCALCFYVLAQAITVPIIAIGPWPLWPNLADIAVGILVLTFMLAKRNDDPLPKPHGTIFRALVIVLIAWLVSFVVSTLLVNLTAVQFGAGKRLVYGIHSLGRLTEFIVIFGLVSIIPLTVRRVEILSRITAITLIFVSLAIIGTHFRTIKTADFVKRLPQGRDAAGPWDNYRMNYLHDGLGTIGYNHHYVAAQVVLLLGLWVALNPKASVPWLAFLLALSTAAVFFTGSRSVFGADVLLSFVLLVRRSIIAPAIIGLGALLLVIVPAVFTPSPAPSDDQSRIVQRQTTTLEFYDAQNLSGREGIWQEKLGAVIDEPSWWLFGRGLGSSVDTGTGASAHLMALQIVVETGIVGLVSIALLFVGLFLILWRSGAHSRPVFWVSAALLITSASYETFYPIPSMGHFLGLFLCTIAISLRLDLVLSQSPTMKAVKLDNVPLNMATKRVSRPAMGTAS
jgi:hypothetical protein